MVVRSKGDDVDEHLEVGGRRWHRSARVDLRLGADELAPAEDCEGVVTLSVSNDAASEELSAPELGGPEHLALLSLTPVGIAWQGNVIANGDDRLSHCDLSDRAGLRQVAEDRIAWQRNVGGNPHRPG